MSTPERKTMSVREMGQILGLGKTESYWLIHRNHFETTLVQGMMRVNIESFEHWYANQIKYKKVDGTPPGEALRAYSYSVAEMAEVLGVSCDIAYSLLKRCDKAIAVEENQAESKAMAEPIIRNVGRFCFVHYIDDES